MSIVDKDGCIDWNNCISFVALIKKDINFNIQKNNLLQASPYFKKILSDNKGKKVKYISIVDDGFLCDYEIL